MCERVIDRMQCPNLADDEWYVWRCKPVRKAIGGGGEASFNVVYHVRRAIEDVLGGAGPSVQRPNIEQAGAQDAHGSAARKTTSALLLPQPCTCTAA